MKHLLLLSGFLCTLGFARGGAVMNPLPTNNIYPVPGPILFPGYTTAAGNNPAALGTTGKGAAIQAAYTPTEGSKEYFGGLTATSQKMGIGLGYIGDDVGGTVVNSGFAGAGFMIDPIAVGIGVRKIDISSGSSPSADLGLLAGEGIGKGQGLRFGFVVYNLNSSATLDLGVGFSGSKNYNMELNVAFPTNNGSNRMIFTVAGNIFASEVFGLSFGTSYYQNSSSYMHRLGLTVWPWDRVAFFGQFVTPGIWTGGLMVMF